MKHPASQVDQFDKFEEDNIQFNVQELRFAPTASLMKAVDIVLQEIFGNGEVMKRSFKLTSAR